MKRYYLLFIVLFLFCKNLSANHTKGGWMFYEYLGPGTAANSVKYKITLKLYTACILTAGQFDPTINFSVFDGLSNQFINNIPVTYSTSPDVENCSLQECHPCISPIPSICYKITTYETTQEFPKTVGGYIISYQRCCRISGIINIESPSNTAGDSWIIAIPGTGVAPGAETNSSARFSQNDTAIICQGNFFTFDFSASDVNGDSLTYAFANAFGGGATGDPTPNPAANPPYASVPYASGFSGAQPMGSRVSINSKTGIVTGIAPASGIYVLTVVVSEFKRGTNIKIAEVRKSLHIQVADCNLTIAKLPSVIPMCDGFTKTFTNDASNANVQTYYWDFGDGNTDNTESPTHTYADTGVYRLKLVLNRGLVCTDSATALVKVFPGFHPDFEVLGQCKNTSILFRDKTTADFGVVNLWNWNFGDFGFPGNTALTQNATHVYADARNYDITFIVGSSKGCIDTLTRTITITEKPTLTVSNDTLICVIDTLQLSALGNGSFNWTPNYNIDNINIANPLVSPDVTTVYYVTMSDPFGCTGTDSVKVSVVNFVTQAAPPDTTICKTDPIILRLSSDALYYQWTEIPAGNSLNNPNIKNPVATPLITTRYHVISSIGKCQAQNDVVVKVVPYPDADAGADQTICIGKSAQLNAGGGSVYVWTPAAFLNNRLIPNPVSVNPSASIRYVVSVSDTLGCPKPVKDTVLVIVADIKADAGPRDTSVVINQPLQLQATGSTHYLWSPATWLNNIAIANPVALPKNDTEYVVKVSNDAGCFDYDSIRVKVYKVAAGLYVPSAFSPNGDGKNDIFRPIALGMKSLDIFKVYNRWGQMLYSGTDMNGGGWDGSFAGKGQDPATYVWYAEGTDYNNKKIKKKGYVVLIR